MGTYHDVSEQGLGEGQVTEATVKEHVGDGGHAARHLPHRLHHLVDKTDK